MKRFVAIAILLSFVLIPNLALAADEKADKKEAPKWDVNNPPGPKTTVNIDTTEGTWMQ